MQSDRISARHASVRLTIALYKLLHKLSLYDPLILNVTL